MIGGWLMLAWTLSGAGPLPLAADRVGEAQPLVIGHRGNSRHAPENTLPAFRSAIEAGADLVELDYHHTADGLPIVLHDATLDRTTDAVQLWGGQKIPVAGRSAAELRQLDAGAWFAASFRGTRLPTLEESLDAILGGALPLVERKAGDAATCIELLRRKGLLTRVVVQAFDWKFLADCRGLEPGLVLGALGDKELTPARIDEASQLGVRVVGWNHKHVGQDEVAAVHQRGLKLWVYTVNDPVRAGELLDWGVDGIITDDPATILPLRDATQRSR